MSRVSDHAHSLRLTCASLSRLSVPRERILRLDAPLQFRAVRSGRKGGIPRGFDMLMPRHTHRNNVLQTTTLDVAFEGIVGVLIESEHSLHVIVRDE